MHCLNSLPDNKVLYCAKLKAFADNKINVIKEIEICFRMGRKHGGKRRKCWFLAFSPFPTFSKVVFFRSLKVGIVWYRVKNPGKSPLKALLEKEKMLVTSIPSFSHYVFYPFQNKFPFFNHIYFVICRSFQF